MRTVYGFGTGGSDPLQRALLVRPDIAYDEDGQEYGDFRDPEPAQGPVTDGPREQENRFDVEDDEQDGNDIKTHRVTTP